MRFAYGLLAFLLSAQLYAASIWHVEGERDFYLFGTIHLLKPGSFPLPDVYEKTLSQCNALWLEVDTRELQDKAVMRRLQQVMLLPVGEKLKDQLSEKTYAKLKELADKAGAPLALLQGLKPWAAANQLTLIIFQQKGFTGEGLDVYLHQQADLNGIPIHAFEDLMWQMNMFDQLSAKYTDEFIEFSTEDMDDVEQLIDDLYRNWQTGDYKTMYEQAAFDGYPEVEAEMLSKRNMNWMKQLLGETHEGVQCVAVGALHMAAEHGLIAQFEKAGYNVTQVSE